MEPNGERTPVQFEEESRIETAYPEAPRMAQLVMKYSGGLIKDERQATYALIGIAVIAAVLAFFVLFGSGDSGSSSSIPFAPGGAPGLVPTP